MMWCCWDVCLLILRVTRGKYMWAPFRWWLVKFKNATIDWEFNLKLCLNMNFKLEIRLNFQFWIKNWKKNPLYSKISSEKSFLLSPNDHPSTSQKVVNILFLSHLDIQFALMHFSLFSLPSPKTITSNWYHHNYFLNQSNNPPPPLQTHTVILIIEKSFSYIAT